MGVVLGVLREGRRVEKKGLNGSVNRNQHAI